MTPLVRWFLILGGLNAGVAVILGAFGAHALKARLSSDMLAVFQTGVQYHFYHALGLFAVAFAASQLPDSALVRWSGLTMVFGILLFSGSLYVLSLTGQRGFGAITPVGGVGFLVAWILLVAAAVRG
jgi:uncharacterized membrane protein YgdD (TMEM256/DUF423 family)